MENIGFYTFYLIINKYFKSRNNEIKAKKNQINQVNMNSNN